MKLSYIFFASLLMAGSLPISASKDLLRKLDKMMNSTYALYAKYFEEKKAYLNMEIIKIQKDTQKIQRDTKRIQRETFIWKSIFFGEVLLVSAIIYGGLKAGYININK